jgi:hypothetical protein
MDELISAVAKALEKGWTVGKIHTTLLAKGWSTDNAFLAIKAGELLFKSIKEADAAKKPPMSGRVL